MTIVFSAESPWKNVARPSGDQTRDLITSWTEPPKLVSKHSSTYTDMYFYNFFLFRFYGPFKNTSLTLSWSFIKGGRKLENLGSPDHPYSKVLTTACEKTNGLKSALLSTRLRGPLQFGYFIGEVIWILGITFWSVYTSEVMKIPASCTHNTR